MALNLSTQVDETGIYEDWAELFNNTNAAIDLGGFYLTDDSSNLSKWQIPIGTILPAQGYQIIWCDEDGSDGPFHANFKLSSTTGEILILSDPNLNVIDQVSFGPQTADLGFARVPNGTGNFIVQAPTFKANNETSSALVNADYPTIEFDAFPNPSNGVVNIRISKLTDNQRIYVFNQLGQQIYNIEAFTEMQLNLESLTAGIYYIKYTDKINKINIIK
jgi:hypothetical protein